MSLSTYFSFILHYENLYKGQPVSSFALWMADFISAPMFTNSMSINETSRILKFSLEIIYANAFNNVLFNFLFCFNKLLALCWLSKWHQIFTKKPIILTNSKFFFLWFSDFFYLIFDSWSVGLDCYLLLELFRTFFK